MSDFFSRLVDRHLGREQGLSLRLQGLFEPEGHGGKGFVEDAQERAPSRPTHVKRQPPQAAQSDLTSPMPQPGEDTPTRQRQEAQPPQHDASREVLRETRIERDPDRQNVTVENHTHETRVIHKNNPAATKGETVRLAPQVQPEEPRPSMPQDDPPVVPETSSRPHESIAAPAADPLPVRRIVPLPEAPAPMSFANPHPKPKPVQPPERRVEVQIGHLEIRQAPAPKPKARKSAASTNPGPDLKTYLGGRRE